MIRHIFRKDDGSAIIEFAITVPVLFLIVLGIADTARLLQRYQVMTNAAREGARMASMPGYTEADVISRVNNYMVSSGAMPDLATAASKVTTTRTPQFVAPADGPSFTAYSVQVQMEYDYPLVSEISSVFGPTMTSVNLTATSLMRVEVARRKLT